MKQSEKKVCFPKLSVWQPSLYKKAPDLEIHDPNPCINYQPTKLVHINFVINAEKVL